MTDEQIDTLTRKYFPHQIAKGLILDRPREFARAILDAQRLEFVEFLREQHRRRDHIGDNTFLVLANKYEAMKGPQ